MVRAWLAPNVASGKTRWANKRNIRFPNMYTPSSMTGEGQHKPAPLKEAAEIRLFK
jgi:hypothetical protein